MREGLVVELSVDSQPDGSAIVWLDEVVAGLKGRQKFFSVSAHDLRGSLANARSFASLLLHPKWNLEGKVRHGLEVVVRNVDRALTLTSDIFDSLRAELATLDADFQELPLGPVIDAAIEKARRAASEHEIGIEENLPDVLPSWLTDSNRLGHVLDALFEHALSRTPPHGVCRIEISPQPADADDLLLLCITDGGRETVAVETLFERDLQVQQTPKLGPAFRLSLARNEVQALGGSLTAEALDHGALRLRLALNRAAAHTLAGGASPTF
jgi:signal transduction histidine kinase